MLAGLSTRRYQAGLEPVGEQVDGEHCPRERQHQREMVRSHQWCTVAFTELVTVLPNDLHDTSKMRIATGAYWPLPDRCRPPRAAQPAGRGVHRPRHHATVPHTLVLAPGW
jgi:hypothetical protein